MIIVLTVAIIAAIAAAGALIRIGYSRRVTWTSFVYQADDGTIRRRTLWDWMQLLIVPLAVAALGVVFALTQEERQATRDTARQAASAEAQRILTIAEARRQTLQDYRDGMVALLVDHGLAQAKPHMELDSYVGATAFPQMQE